MPDLTLGDALAALIDNRGKTPKKLGGEFTSTGVPVASAQLVRDGRLMLDEARYVSHEMYQRWMPFAAKTHDVLLTSEAPLGRVALVPDDEPLVLGQRLFGLRGRPGTLDSRFLFYAFQTERVQAELLGRATGTTVVGIRQSELVKVRIPAPSFNEQLAIAHVLGALDDKIVVNQQVASVASALAAAHYDGLAARAVGVTPLDSILDLRYGKALPAVRRSAGHVPVYGSGGVVGYHDKALVTGPGIVVGRKGTVGTVYWAERDFFPIDTTFYIEMRRADLPLELAYYVLRGLRLKTMNSDSAVPGLSRASVAAKLVPDPPSAEDALRFARLVRPLFELQYSLEKQSSNLSQLRDALLPGLMSGRIRVREAERAVEQAT